MILLSIILPLRIFLLFFVVLTIYLLPDWFVNFLQYLCNNYIGKDIIFCLQYPLCPYIEIDIQKEDQFSTSGQNNNPGKIKQGKPVIALTIDDSPTKNTFEILTLLNHYKVKATFFIISNYIEELKDEKYLTGNQVMEKIIKDGHEVGNHTVNDEAAWKMSQEEFREKLLECERALSKYDNIYSNDTQTNRGDNTSKEKDLIQKPAGKKATLKHHSKKKEVNAFRRRKLFRPGHGLINKTMMAPLYEFNYLTILANIFPYDANGWWKCNSNFPSLNSWYLCKRARPGSIIVIHDREWTIKVLQYALPILSQKYYITTVSEFLAISEAQGQAKK